MCEACKASPMGEARQRERALATTACLTANVRPDAVSSFLVRHAYHGRTPQYTPEQRAALDRYSAAQSALKTLHTDYVFFLARQGVATRKEK